MVNVSALKAEVAQFFVDLFVSQGVNKRVLDAL